MRRSAADLLDQSRPFGRLAVVHALQAAGATLVAVSLAGSLFFSISPNAAKGKVLLYLILTIAPFAVVGPALSPLLDRGRGARRASVAVANAGSALLCLAMSVDLHGLLLFPEAFGVLVLGKLYMVARAALVPGLLGRDDDLASANARLAVLASISGFVAFPVGVLVLRAGASWVLRASALVLLAGAVASLRLPRPPRSVVRSAPGPAAPPSRPPARGAQSRGGWAGSVGAAVGALSMARASVGFVAFFLAFELRRAHAGAWWFGILLAASGAGSLLGSLVVPRARRFLGERQIIEVALVAMAVGALAAFLGGDRWAQMMLTFVVGVGPTSAKPALDSLVQRRVPPWALGRAFGRIETRLQLSWVAAALLGVVVPFPLRLGDLVVAIGCAAAAVAYLATALPERRAPAGSPS